MYVEELTIGEAKEMVGQIKWMLTLPENAGGNEQLTWDLEDLEQHIENLDGIL
jgi:hypothetical protein